MEIVPFTFLSLGLNCVTFIVCVSLFPNVYHLSLSLSFLGCRVPSICHLRVPISSTSEEQLFSDLTKSNWQLLASDSSRGGKQLNVICHHLCEIQFVLPTNVSNYFRFLKYKLSWYYFIFVTLL